MPAEALPLHEALETMEPRRVAEHFDIIRQTPRRSYAEMLVRIKVAEWAEKQGFKYRVDAPGSIAVDVPASPGSEDKPRVIVQAHMDMVCNVKKGAVHDFGSDPIELETTGDFLHSRDKETTLGADDGIGMAIGMAALEDVNNKRPPVTLLFTADEEKTFQGAFKLGDNMIPEGDLAGVINIDSEAGAQNICYGSASGREIKGEWDTGNEKEDLNPSDYSSFTIELEGLRGGHSGVDCYEYDKRGSAIVFLRDILNNLRQEIPGFMLENFEGGQAKNIFSESATCVIHIPLGHEAKLALLLAAFEARLKASLEDAEDENHITLKATPLSSQEGQRRVLTVLMRDKLLNALNAVPQGAVKSQSPEFPLVSNNIGIVKVQGDRAQVVCFARGAVTESVREEELRDEIRGALSNQGAKLEPDIIHGAWQEPEDSPLVEIAKTVIREQGQEPVAFAYHAGLEVQAIADRLKQLGRQESLNLVAIGPRIVAAHSTRERLQISSVKDAHSLLVGMLAKLAA